MKEYLKGKNVSLVPLNISHLEKIHYWHTNPNLFLLTLGIRFPISMELDRQWLESILSDKSNRNVYYAICKNDSDEIIGVISLNKIDWISRSCYFGIILGEENARGKGLGKESMDLLFQYAFGVLNIRKISLEVVNYNPAKNLYEKFGFKEEGRLKEHIYLNKMYYDLIIYSIFNKDSKN